MIRRIGTFALSCVIAGWAIQAVAQSASNADLQKQINTLNETEKAILKELQEIRKLLQQQQPGTVGDALPTQPMDISKEPFRGAANAKIALIEFSDYQCPFCERYEKETYPQLIKEYVETGKVKYVWRDLPLDMHQYAEKAAEAAHCAGEQGKFWDMHDRLFANQQNLAAADLLKHAQALELNTGLFQQCLDSGRFAADIKKDMQEASSAGISGTPTFLFGLVQPNGSVKIAKKVIGAKAYSEFKVAIDSLLTTGRAAGGSTR